MKKAFSTTTCLVLLAVTGHFAVAEDSRPIRWGVDDAGSALPLLLHPKGKELFE